MTQVASNAHRVEIVAAPSTALALGVAALNAQIAGGGSRWIEVTTLGATTALWGGTSGDNPFTNQMVWDTYDDAIRFCSSHHGAPTMYDIQYLESTNTWTRTPEPAIQQTHGYGHNAMNPYTGDRFTRNNGNGNSPGGEPVVRKLRGGSWSTFTPVSPAVYAQIGIGTQWWSGSLTGVGAQGAWILSEGTFGYLWIYDPLANSGAGGWGASFQYAPTTPISYHDVAAYSASKNVMVFGGGNGAPRKVWRLNANKTVTVMPDCPINYGIQRANMITDPVTGNILIWGGGVRQFWELDPSTGTYTQLTGVRAPPPRGAHGLSDPGEPAGDGSLDSITSGPISKYGVIAYVSVVNNNWANMLLYKHA